jgi:hypothetical protein
MSEGKIYLVGLGPGDSASRAGRAAGTTPGHLQT